MDFASMIENSMEPEKVRTWNGAVAYASSGEKLLDFNFSLASLRGEKEDVIAKKFKKMLEEDEKTAVAYLFYMGDVRGGIGEDRTFNICFETLCKHNAPLARKLIHLIPEYACWKNLIQLYGKTDVEILPLIEKQLEDDLANVKAGKSCSLLGKWLPSENASSRKTKRLAVRILNDLGFTPREYRKTLSSLRAGLDVVERKMSAKQWGEINYSTVPSIANNNYRNAFMRNDTERRTSFLQSLKSGDPKVKINAAVLSPHEIVRKYDDIICQNSYYGRFGADRVNEDETLEALWKNLPVTFDGNILVVRDGSASMITSSNANRVSPMSVATALAIYTAEHNKGCWKDKFITFSMNPKMVKFKEGASLLNRIAEAYRQVECSSTNIEAVMELVLKTALDNNLKQEEMPETILIISDMEFDMATRVNYFSNSYTYSPSLFDSISAEYNSHGYKIPRLVFWNVNQLRATIPMQKNDMGLVLMSGYSTQLLKMAMSNEVDPYKVLLEQITSERYAPVWDVLDRYNNMA